MIQSVRGTKDILPSEIHKWHRIEKIFKNISNLFGYRELRTPIFEKTEVFSRSIGETSDIVNKEMYTFLDKGGESITLRPEMTAALVRSVIQHQLIEQSSILRLWYFGPFFRYERPQKGRLRQFHQYGAECLGSPFPEADAEVIILADSILKSCGIEEYDLLLNTLGTNEARSKYRKALVEYFQIFKNELSDDSKFRLETNPLRILDSKDQNDLEIIKNAPDILNYLDTESLIHFEKVQDYLNSNNISYTISSQLVRGLDYYCHTVFEFRSKELGAQDSFGGGGRYDGLFEQLGGKKTPAVGFAMGVERLILILDNLNNQSADSCDYYIACSNPEFIKIGLEIQKKLISRNFSVRIDLLRRSLKAQLREANKYNAKFVIIIGEEEIKRQSFVLKDMQSGTQREISLNDVESLAI